MSEKKPFKLTYANMFNPPEELHQQYEAALVSTKSKLGKEYGMLIDGKEIRSSEKVEDIFPADTRVVLGVFQKGTSEHALQAIAAAKKAFPAWSHTPWQERVRLLRKAADRLDERILRSVWQSVSRSARTAWKH